MLFALSLLLPLLILSLWLYFRFSPRRDNPQPVFLFNLVAVLIAAIACGVVVLQVRTMMLSSPDRAWWPVLAAFYAMVTLPGCLALAAGLRHLLFRGPRTPSKPLDTTRDLSNTRF